MENTKNTTHLLITLVILLAEWVMSGLGVRATCSNAMSCGEMKVNRYTLV